MAPSTNGQLCFGILLEEETELPWDDDKYDHCVTEWWRDTNGFPEYKEESFEDGEWRGEDFDEWLKRRRAFDATCPCPVELVNCCSDSYEMWIVAVPRTCKSACRGYPEEFDPAELTVTPEEAATLVAFCETHKIEYQGNPQWLLSSYWSD